MWNSQTGVSSNAIVSGWYCQSCSQWISEFQENRLWSFCAVSVEGTHVHLPAYLSSSLLLLFTFFPQPQVFTSPSSHQGKRFLWRQGSCCVAWIGLELLHSSDSLTSSDSGVDGVQSQLARINNSLFSYLLNGKCKSEHFLWNGLLRTMEIIDMI